jgi:glycine cleavage system H protein
MLILGFDYPDDRHYWPLHDVWCQPQADGTLRVGITAFGAHLGGDVYMCRPKAVGCVLLQGQGVAVAELSKSVISIKTPVGGEVVRINPKLEDQPELLAGDSYGEGWLAELQPTDWAADQRNLVHGEAARQVLTQRMLLEPEAGAAAP